MLLTTTVILLFAIFEPADGSNAGLKFRSFTTRGVRGLKGNKVQQPKSTRPPTKSPSKVSKAPTFETSPPTPNNTQSIRPTVKDEVYTSSLPSIVPSVTSLPPPDRNTPALTTHNPYSLPIENSSFSPTNAIPLQKEEPTGSPMEPSVFPAVSPTIPSISPLFSTWPTRSTTKIHTTNSPVVDNIFEKNTESHLQCDAEDKTWSNNVIISYKYRLQEPSDHKTILTVQQIEEQILRSVAEEFLDCPNRRRLSETEGATNVTAIGPTPTDIIKLEDCSSEATERKCVSVEGAFTVSADTGKSVNSTEIKAFVAKLLSDGQIEVPSGVVLLVDPPPPAAQEKDDVDEPLEPTIATVSRSPRLTYLIAVICAFSSSLILFLVIMHIRKRRNGGRRRSNHPWSGARSPQSRKRKKSGNADRSALSPTSQSGLLEHMSRGMPSHCHRDEGASYIAPPSELSVDSMSYMGGSSVLGGNPPPAPDSVIYSDLAGYADTSASI